MEQHEAMFLTSFAFEFNGERLNDYITIGSIPDVKSGITLLTVNESYTDRSMRQHVHHFREILNINAVECFWFVSILLLYCCIVRK